LVPPSDLPDENSRLLFRIYAVLALAKGEAVTAEDVHNAWVAWASSINADHESLVPFNELDHETASFDKPYVEAIHEASRRLRAID
jgi:hypothetical protein